MRPTAMKVDTQVVHGGHGSADTLDYLRAIVIELRALRTALPASSIGSVQAELAALEGTIDALKHTKGSPT